MLQRWCKKTLQELVCHVTDNIGHYTQPPSLPPMPLLHPTLSSSHSPLSPINQQSNIQSMLFHCQCIALHCCALLCIEEANKALIPRSIKKCGHIIRLIETIYFVTARKLIRANSAVPSSYSSLQPHILLCHPHILLCPSFHSCYGWM